MRVFVYEFITGGGTFHDPDLIIPSGSLLREGRAMATALAMDFARVGGVAVSMLRDDRIGSGGVAAADCYVKHVRNAREHDESFRRLANESDWTVVIAPECDGHLLSMCCLAEDVGARLMSPPSNIVRWAADKHETVRRLHSVGVPTPRGGPWSACEPLPAEVDFPIVLKPARGAGSVGIRLVRGVERVGDETFPREVEYRWEEWLPGRPASVAVLTCPDGPPEMLRPCWQHLSTDGCLSYMGGSLVADEAIAARVWHLAQRVMLVLPRAVGYLGVDLILGDAQDGSGDVVVEINPRLTTWYVGLRAATDVNLADVMWRVATGERTPRSYGWQTLDFAADGTCRASGHRRA